MRLLLLRIPHTSNTNVSHVIKGKIELKLGMQNQSLHEPIEIYDKVETLQQLV